jgi:hypothetical protein
VRKRAAHVSPAGHEDPSHCADEQRGDDAWLHRRAVDLAADQLGENAGALRMPDQHHATTAVVVREVVVPCGTDVLVSDVPNFGHGIAGGESATYGGARNLPVQGREQSTLCAKPRQLQSHDVALGGVGTRSLTAVVSVDTVG